MGSRVEWNYIYEEICRNLHIDCKMDNASAERLGTFKNYSDILMKRLKHLQSRNFLVVGNSPHVDMNSFVKTARPDEIIAVADSAIRVIPPSFIPHIIISDLDGDLLKIKNMVRSGSILFIHAHGDNMEKIQHNAEDFSGLFIPTRQGERPEYMYNPMGFTDGDRAVRICRDLGAKNIRLFGFSYDNPYEKGDIDLKRKKLAIAKRIIDSIDDVNITYV